MRVLLVGMHRSGTSALARVLNLMGLYLGEEHELMPPKPDNPAGFWERTDVLQLNEEVFATLGTTWHTVADDDLGRLCAVDRRRFEQRLRSIVERLDRHRPWLVKDPRLCLLLPLWRAVVPDPVVVLMARRPVQVAQSLATRNGFELPVGVALWEEHTTAALRHTVDLPRVLVAHHELMAQPNAVADRLFAWLDSLGASGIRRAAPEAVAGFIRADLFRADGDEAAEAPYLNPDRRQLLEDLFDGAALTRPAPTLSPDARELLATHRRAAATTEELERLRGERQAFDADRALLEAERDTARTELERVVSERTALFAEKNSLLEERNDLFEQKSSLLAERNAVFEEKNTYLAERDELFVAKISLLAQLETVAAERNNQSAEVHTLRFSNARLTADLEASVERLEQLRDQLGVVMSSRDYRLGKALLDPVRAVRRRLTRWRP